MRNGYLCFLPVCFGISADVGLFKWVGFYGWFLFLMLLNSVTEELVYRAYPIEALLEAGENPFWPSAFQRSPVFIGALHC